MSSIHLFSNHFFITGSLGGHQLIEGQQTCLFNLCVFSNIRLSGWFLQRVQTCRRTRFWTFISKRFRVMIQQFFMNCTSWFFQAGFKFLHRNKSAVLRASKRASSVFLFLYRSVLKPMMSSGWGTFRTLVLLGSSSTPSDLLHFILFLSASGCCHNR